MNVLMQTELFTSAGIGRAGTKSAQYETYERILGEPDAVKLLTKVAAEAKPAGRLFALQGLCVKVPDRCGALGRSLLDSTEQVETFQGCTRSSMPVSDVAKSI